MNLLAPNPHCCSPQTPFAVGAAVLVLLGLPGMAHSRRALPRAGVVDMMTPDDLTLPPDLTTPPDLSPPPDLVTLPDLLPPPDLARPDLTPPPDLAKPDLSVPPDLADVPDLAPAPDLYQPDLAQPDLATMDLSLPDFAQPDLSLPDLARSPDLRAPDLALIAPSPDLPGSPPTGEPIPGCGCHLGARLPPAPAPRQSQLLAAALLVVVAQRAGRSRRLLASCFRLGSGRR